MNNILEKIVANTRIEVEARQRTLPIEQLKQMIEAQTHTVRSFAETLRQSPTGIIAEFKRKSPSLGWIKEEGRADVIPAEYAHNGAAALSILTDEVFFGGKLPFIEVARPMVEIPILRKDFIIDNYQIYEAKKAGADAILLIAACLTRHDCASLAQTARHLGLEVLLEVHNEEEIAHYCEGVTAIGVNNRNLKTFVTDLRTSIRLAPKLPSEVVCVAESGLARPEDVLMLRSHGFGGFLMGEAFMKTASPGQALAHFIRQLLCS